MSKNLPSIKSSEKQSLANLQDTPHVDTSPSQPQSTSMSESDDEGPPPGYTRRLIPMIGIPADEIDENFDEAAWFKKLYDPDIIVVETTAVPRGWILVDGIYSSFWSY